VNRWELRTSRTKFDDVSTAGGRPSVANERRVKAKVHWLRVTPWRQGSNCASSILSFREAMIPSARVRKKSRASPGIDCDEA
jgi:hypothetical protein